MTSVSASKFIQEFCKPYENLRLVNFMHDITFGKGQISMLVSSKDIFLFYKRNKIPMLCTDDSGRTLKNGIYINRILETQYKSCSILMPLMVRIGKQFKYSFGRNSLHIIFCENDCQHMYSLFFDLSEADFLHWVINNGSLLYDLIENYNIRTKEIILEAKSPNNRIILPNFKPIISQTSESTENLKLKGIIHKSLNTPVYLPSQQSKCLGLLMQGKSAKEIGLEMNLSYRTVEHYIGNLKKILGCATSRELIISYIDQLHGM